MWVFLGLELTGLLAFFLQATPATVFGLLGEGVLPPPDLAHSVASLEHALSETVVPTAVVARSRSAGHPATGGTQWLPDTFIAQVWCNHAMLTGLSFDDELIQDLPLLGLLPRLLRQRQTTAGISQPVLVDGTHLVPSVFDSKGDGRPPNVIGGSRSALNGGVLYIGRLELALVRSENEGDGGLKGGVSIGTAPWPPVYVLEHVATDTGLILVNSVNCGYLDMAVNFLLAARKVVCDAKVQPRKPHCSSLRRHRSESRIPALPICYLYERRWYPYPPVGYSL